MIPSAWNSTRTKTYYYEKIIFSQKTTCLEFEKEEGLKEAGQNNGERERLLNSMKED